MNEGSDKFDGLSAEDYMEKFDFDYGRKPDMSDEDWYKLWERSEKMFDGMQPDVKKRWHTYKEAYAAIKGAAETKEANEFEKLAKDDPEKAVRLFEGAYESSKYLAPDSFIRAWEYGPGRSDTEKREFAAYKQAKKSLGIDVTLPELTVDEVSAFIELAESKFDRRQYSDEESFINHLNHMYDISSLSEQIIIERYFNALQYRDWETDRKSTRLNSSHSGESRMPSSA